MVHMVSVVEWEQIFYQTDDYIAQTRRFDVLLECGHLQQVETTMPTPPTRIMCTLCMDSHQADQV